MIPPVYLGRIRLSEKLNLIQSGEMSSKSKNAKPNVKKNKLSKLIKDSESENGETEKELSFYINDRVKLMKEVLKIIKPRKIRSMAPSCIKNLDNDEINSMLLEELLGISNKRLKYIFNGQNLEEDSSTDPEEEQSPADVISLDDISDDDFVIDLDSDHEGKSKRCRKHRKINVEPKKIKKEKHKESNHRSTKVATEADGTSEQNLMSVLELLELQARARAIRSQLALESQKKAEEIQKTQDTFENIDSDDNDDAVIITSPKNEEIVITSSDSENESSQVSTINENTCESTKDSSKVVDDSENLAESQKNDAEIKEPSSGHEEVETDYNKQDQNDIVEESAEDKGVTDIPLPEVTAENGSSEKRKTHRKCRRKHRDRTSSSASDKNVEKRPKMSEKHATEVAPKANQDDGDGLVLNVEQSEIDCINLD